MNHKAEVRVFTFKEGLLSRLAHDLRLSARAFEISLHGGAIEARFVPHMLRVDGAMRNGRLDTSVLSASDRAKIEHTIVTEILDGGHRAEVVFHGAVASLGSDRFSVEGRLEMLATDRSIAMTLFRRGDRAEGEVVLHPSKWGISPYRALGGALKLQDRVVVCIELSLPGGLVVDPVEDQDLVWTAG